MLFFKDLFDEKMSDSSFESFFRQECHICDITVKLVAIIDADAIKKGALQADLGISDDQYNQLKAGDYCDPEMVFSLCRVLNMDTDGREKRCPRLNQIQTS